MFKIGDFSRLTRISVRMLRHYDEIGLLKPISIDNFTGYRYYSVDQMATVNKIIVLKEMGFSLSEISNLLEKDLDTKQIIVLLENRKRVISETIEQEKEKLLRVESLIKFMNKENINMNYDISIKNVPAYKVISLRDIITAYNAEGKLWDELNTYIEKNNIKTFAPCYAIYHDTGFKESDVDVEVTMCVNETIVETDRIKEKVLGEVSEMAVIFHKGPFEEMSLAYHQLGVWLSSNHYEMCGPTRAIYHKGPWCVSDSSEYLTEIQAPVCKKVGR
ncbi:MAG: transcriptional activator ligand binding domain protein [Anaerocolumna sp.]|jgi:effector-binding domain-containing protein|nr:transcriptional activator ligand binding domain protein [Anaerocolumna sp.]